MTKEDYVASGGALKLKGVSNGKIEKKRKKKQIPAESHGIVENTKDQERRRETQIEESDRTIGAEHIVRAEAEAAVSSKLSSDQVGTSRAVQKTEAEIKHDEAKRRRVIDTRSMYD